MWTNLIDNAVAAMGGHGTLTVRTATDRDTLLVEFGDTGPGIPRDPAAYLRAVLHHQAGRAGDRAGLDISWRIVVKKHYGEIHLTSEPGDYAVPGEAPLVTPDPDRQKGPGDT